MDENVLDRFRRALTLRRDHLLAWLGREASHEGHPGLGDRNGRAGAEGLPVLDVIDEALERIEDGRFGRCTLCSDEVEEERLALDFTTAVCLDHYTAAQVRALERDLELAARVQRQLFPCGVPAVAGLQMAAHARPAHLLSGDYYDFFLHRDGMQGVVIADVMGKGLPAGMLMANLQASLRILGPEHDALDALAARLNELFRYNLKLIRFISLFLMAVDGEAGVLHYCNAGHHPPLWWNAASGAVRWLRPTGPAIGLMHSPGFRTETLRYGPGDVFLLYTDGLVEARNAAGEAFGEERLARYVAQHHCASAGELLAGLRQAAVRFAEGSLEDDVALLVIKADGAPAGRSADL